MLHHKDLINKKNAIAFIWENIESMFYWWCVLRKEDFMNLPRCLRIVFSMVLFSENPFVRWQEQDFHEVIIRFLSFRVKLLSNIKLGVAFSQQSASFMMMWIDIEESDCCVWIRNDVLTLKTFFSPWPKLKGIHKKCCSINQCLVLMEKEWYS